MYVHFNEKDIIGRLRYIAPPLTISLSLHQAAIVEKTSKFIFLSRVAASLLASIPPCGKPNPFWGVHKCFLTYLHRSELISVLTCAIDPRREACLFWDGMSDAYHRARASSSPTQTLQIA
ncbi:hypothetical protein TWF569_011070 [Orbilia oligospora]|uniref:Uncharacterized protein n=1 Tax=Orbilia oligospora TaxID=2813651 RepID=A0A7C8N2G5_ORBOL|nr:hypothetical protein TWF102_003273 [Orbilia oligospora]KAF3094093.1 hypothetical protein TWF706_008625 [Orbilia oligospora]KAF3096086.1 hypothetical protein TWF103_009979 [Orbilia oligospora]KAF3131914.1 hypothetical protein TWF569_011070 [Orbilia oligospora]KAF3131931.1 hypothetical protein TWF594_009649 [Orbilia oligospora]